MEYTLAPHRHETKTIGTAGLGLLVVSLLLASGPEPALAAPKEEKIKPKEIHILSAPPTIGKKKLRAVTPRRQRQIADIVAEETGLSVTIHETEAAVS